MWCDDPTTGTGRRYSPWTDHTVRRLAQCVIQREKHGKVGWRVISGLSRHCTNLPVLFMCNPANFNPVGNLNIRECSKHFRIGSVKSICIKLEYPVYTQRFVQSLLRNVRGKVNTVLAYFQHVMDPWNLMSINSTFDHNVRLIASFLCYARRSATSFPLTENSLNARIFFENSDKFSTTNPDPL